MLGLLYAHGGESHNLGLGWSFDPVLPFLALALVLFFKGWQKLARKQEALWCGLGAVLLVLALCSPLDALADRAFSFHMAQHLILTMLSPLAFLWAKAPQRIGQALPTSWKEGQVASALRLAYRWLSQPHWSLGLMVACFWVWHLPFLYQLALENPFWHGLEHACFFWSALWFWSAILSGPHSTRSVQHLAKMVILVLALFQNSVLGALLVFGSRPLYHFAPLPNLLGLNPLEDQILGGLVMWLGGGMMYWLAFSILFVQSIKREEAQQLQGAP